MIKFAFYMSILLGGSLAKADCFIFEDFEDTELIKKAELCYEGYRTSLVRFQLTYANGEVTEPITNFEMRATGSEEAGNLVHGVENENFWMMVEWASDSITVFDEKANQGSFLDLPAK